MNMNLETLQHVLDKLFQSGGHTIIHGQRAYMIHRTEHSAWINWLPVGEYKRNQKGYDVSPVGWYALLRIA